MILPWSEENQTRFQWQKDHLEWLDLRTMKLHLLWLWNVQNGFVTELKTMELRAGSHDKTVSLKVTHWKRVKLRWCFMDLTPRSLCKGKNVINSASKWSYILRKNFIFSGADADIASDNSATMLVCLNRHSFSVSI